VEVLTRAGDGVKLEVTEEGWSLTDGDARLVLSGDEGTELRPGSVAVLGDGRLLFTPGALTRDVDEAAMGGVEARDRQRGREQAPDVGQRRESFRVDIVTEVTVTSDVKSVTASTINVSNTGCLLQVEGLVLRDGQEVTVALPLADPLALAAIVRRLDADGRTGLMFHRMDAAEERRLSAWLAERQRQMLRRR